MSYGRILLSEGKYEEAAAELDKATKSDPASARSFYFLGVSQKSLGLSDQARVSFSNALKQQPGMLEAASALADLNAKRGNYEEALRLAGIATKSNPNSPQGFIATAQALLAKGDTRQGETMLQSALERDPASVSALAMLVKLYDSQGRSQEAVRRIGKQTTIHPENSSLHLLLAVAYFNLKDLERSEAGVRRAIALDRRTPNAYSLLANIDYSKGSVEKAKTDLRTAIELNPRNVPNYMVLENWYKREGNWEEAKRLCEKAHQIDPASPEIATELAFLYLEHGGDVNLALSLAQGAKQKLPNSLPVADTLGWAYYKMGSAASAIVQLKECVQKSPDNSIYQYHLGMAYMAAGHSQSAGQALHQALKHSPNFAYAANARAVLDKISKMPL